VKNLHSGYRWWQGTARLNGQFGAVFRRQSHHAANFIDAHANNFALYAKDNDNAWSVLILRTRAQQRGKIEHRHNRPAQINRAKHLGMVAAIAVSVSG
jgi:hypothetical protein